MLILKAIYISIIKNYLWIKKIFKNSLFKSVKISSVSYIFSYTVIKCWVLPDTRKKQGLNFLQVLPQENVSLKSLYLCIPNVVVIVEVLKINYAHMLSDGTLHYLCLLNFRAHSKWFVCCGDPVMYVFYYYYFCFFQCHSNYIFFRHAVCYVHIRFYISDVEGNTVTVSDLPKL